MFIVEGKETTLVLHVDFELFSIALKNILDNALKYSREKVLIKVSQNKIAVCSVGENLEFDKGDFQKPFNRPYESSASGLGLGLYLTDSILQKHNMLLNYYFEKGYNCFEIRF
jgi:two-component system OmpR family sensor kinase